MVKVVFVRPQSLRNEQIEGGEREREREGRLEGG